MLIGTRSVDKSEKLSVRLKAAAIPHQVLNAKPENVDREADIVAQAGRLGDVTIATNMAGRGTDIILGGNPETIAWSQLRAKYASRSDVPLEEWKHVVEEIEVRENMREERKQVKAAGGLHVLGTERHEARRIDRQLAGRAGRQGDPGSSQFFLCLEDELLEGLGTSAKDSWEAFGQRGGDRDWQRYRYLFEKAQRKMERRHYISRVDLMVHEKHRMEVLKDLGADPYVD